MTRKAAPKRKTAQPPKSGKKVSPAKKLRKGKSTAKAKTTTSPRKGAHRARSGAASSAVIGLVSGSDFLPRAPIAPNRSRKQRKGVTVYLDPAQKDVLDAIATRHAMTLQDLGLEAFDLLFEKYAHTQPD